MDQLARDYQDESVVFIEQDVDHPVGSRYTRWWDAFIAGGGGSAVLPFMMVGSGHQVADGLVASPSKTTESYLHAIKAMIDEELARPAEAEIDAFAHRVGNHFEVTVWVTNRSSQTLNHSSNFATINGIVFEDSHVMVTDRFTRSAVAVPITANLYPDSTSVYEFSTPELSGVNWDKLHNLTFVDYKTADNHFNMLQAAVTEPYDLVLRPDDFSLMFDFTDPPMLTKEIRLRGPTGLNWSVSEEIYWLEISPNEATIFTSPSIEISSENLSAGWQEGKIEFIATGYGTSYLKQVPVRVFYGTIHRVYLPTVRS